MEHILTGDVGGRLKHARELRGLSLSDVARRTKLPSKVLHAIERNDFASLPGGMFRKAYIRTVAAEVGLDPREVVAEYCDRFEPPIAAVAVPTRDAALQDKWLEQLTPSPQRSMVGLAAVAVPALAWFMLQSVAAGTRAPVDSAASETAAAPMSQPASIALTADSSGGTATPSVTPAPAAPLRIEMAATGPCWVAAERDGERVMYRLVEPGERVVLEGQRMIALRLGNAGAVTLSINAGASRSFGRDGQVVELEVTPDNVDALRDGAVTTKNTPLRVLG